MQLARFISVSLIAAMFAIAACGGAAPLPKSLPRAQRDVVVGKGDPPRGSADLGPIEVAHGSGCGAFGQAGSLEGAMILLRIEALKRGANFVSLLSVVPPHSETGCFDQRYKLVGIAYRTAATSDAAAPAAAATTGPATTGPAATGPAATGPAATGPAATAAATPTTCTPICSPGYRCQSAVCVAECNPACGAGMVCRQDRVCVQAPPQSPPAR